MAVWDTAYINDLPDSAFLYVEPGGTKDDGGKTVPRSLRHFPVKDASGAIDMPHLRNALSRIPQADLPQSVKDTARRKAEAMMNRSAEVPVENRSSDTELEFRSVDGGDGLHFEGYAATFNSPSEPLPFIETIVPGAFDRSLRRDKDIKFLVDHNPERLLASTQAGTLQLAEDKRGLHVEADLAPTSYAQDLKVLADRGEIRSMSFTFRADKDGEHWDGMNRSLTNVRLFHVAVLTGKPPAYPETTAQLRSLAHRIDRDPDSLTLALSAIREGREFEPDELSALEAAIAVLRPAPLGTPLLDELRNRMLVLEPR